MSATSILASLTTSQDAVLMRLKEAADVLCKDHIHFMAPLAINQGEIVDLYTMTIDCGEDDIVWAVEMWPNCRLKSIKRCKKVSIPNVNPARPSLPLIQPRYVWAEGICNEILKLIRMAHPGENWWANDSVFQSDQPNDLYYLYNPGSRHNVALNQPRTIHAGYQAFQVGPDVPPYYHTSERFMQLPIGGC